MSITTPIQKLPSHVLSSGVSPWLTIKDLTRSSSVCRSWHQIFTRDEILWHFQHSALPAIKAFSESLVLRHGTEFEAQVEVLDESSNNTLTLKSLNNYLNQVNDYLNQSVPPTVEKIKYLHHFLEKTKSLFCNLFARLTSETFKTITESVPLPSQFLGDLFDSAEIPRAGAELSITDSEENFLKLFLSVCRAKDTVEVGFKTLVDLQDSRFLDKLWRINGILIDMGGHRRALELCNWLPSSSLSEEDFQGTTLTETILSCLPPSRYEGSTRIRDKMEKEYLEDFLAAAKKIASKVNREKALEALYMHSMDMPETDAFREAVDLEIRKSNGSGLTRETIFQGWLKHGKFDKALSMASQSPNKRELEDRIFSAREERFNRQLVDFYRSHNWVPNTEKNSSGKWVVTWKPPLSQPKNSLKWDVSSSELIAGSKKGFLGTRKSLKTDAPASESRSASTSVLNLKKRKEPAS